MEVIQRTLKSEKGITTNTNHTGQREPKPFVGFDKNQNAGHNRKDEDDHSIPSSIQDIADAAYDWHMNQWRETAQNDKRNTGKPKHLGAIHSNFH